MPTPCFYLNVTIRGYEAEVFVNGAPILSAVRDYQCAVAPPVSPWVVQGENTLSVVVSGGTLCDPHVEEAARRERAAGGEEVGPPPSDPEVDPEYGPVLRVAMCQGIIGEVVDPGTERELFVIEWTPPPVPQSEDVAPLALPHELTASGAISHPWGTWAWEGAPAFDFETDPGGFIDVLDFLRGLHDAVSTGQLSTFADAGQQMFDEVSPCFDLDPADARGRLARAWPEISKGAGFALSPFEESDIELRPCCDGRVLEARSLGGEPLLRQAEPIDGTSWSLPVFVAKIGDQLQVIR